MRRGLGIAGACAAICLLAGPARAQNVDTRWAALSNDEQQIVDLLAAEFYQQDLRLAQSRVIEARTAELYVSGDGQQRAHFRASRRAAWDAMSPEARKALRNADKPAYANLTDDQKEPFRKVALDKLDAAGAVDEKALAIALRREI
ncbi:MAG TPA: hypothetical protein VNH64_03050 [Parvularculaceae bacterium]|nr:hypothetical protein [Parvularculaceae bacterium]